MIYIHTVYVIYEHMTLQKMKAELNTAALSLEKGAKMYRHMSLNDDIDICHVIDICSVICYVIIHYI